GGRTVFSGDPAKNDDPNKNGNTDIAQPKMPALELRDLRLALVEPAGILNTCRTGDRVGLRVRLVLVHDGSFSHSFILAGLGGKCKAVLDLQCARASRKLWSMPEYYARRCVRCTACSSIQPQCCWSLPFPPHDPQTLFFSRQSLPLFWQ